MHSGSNLYVLIIYLNCSHEQNIKYQFHKMCSNQEAIDDGDEEWWLAVESTASQVELTYTSTNSECSQHNSARQ